ncbi:MAG: IclR family transcriptional regulator [Longimicrobiales bacterium]
MKRTIDLLRAFHDGRAEYTLTELATSLHLNKTAVHRLLGVLEEADFVVRNPDTGAYRLGPEMIMLGATALRSNDLRTAGHAELSALAREAEESATLEVLVGTDVVIVDEVAGPHVLSPAGETGTRWPAHATSTGKVLLAWREALPKSLRLTALTPNTITSRARLDKELVQVRRRGYAAALEELEVGFVAVAAPVRDHDGRVVAAIGIGGPGRRISRTRIVSMSRLVTASADRASTNLGWKKRG